MKPHERVIVVGAGMAGVSAAWHLQKRGVPVLLIDRTGVAAGSSWGNAGYLSPALTLPLADPSLWGYLIKSLFDPNAPLSVPLRFDPELISFLLKFIRHATPAKWQSALELLSSLSSRALPEYEYLLQEGVPAALHDTEFLLGFTDEESARPVLKELDAAAKLGLPAKYRLVGANEAPIKQLAPALSHVYALEGQKFIAPGDFVTALHQDFTRLGGESAFGSAVSAATADDTSVTVTLDSGEHKEGSRLILATGAWLPSLARKFGVNQQVRAGRGYSFSVAADPAILNPIYLPAQRVACTPYHGRLRIAGTMEFLNPDTPPKQRRIAAIVNTVRPLFSGLDFDDRQDEWVGSRPISTDGLPLIGKTQHPLVFVAGGHGMWGIVLGPITGKLLAEEIISGKTPEILKPFSPLRR